MKIALFSSTSYDTKYFEITHFEARLRKRTAHLAAGFDAVCVFVNDEIDRETLKILKEHHISVVALRCAGRKLLTGKAYGI